MVAANTGSILTEAGRNVTRTGVSTNIIIQVDGNPVGAVQSLSINENRGIATIDEVGTDGHIDSVPNKSTDISGSCTRIRFDNLRVAAAFSRGFVHAHSQRIPFDIVILDIFAADSNDQGNFDNADNVIITTIKNVWIQKIGTNYQATDFVITDTMDWVAETIYTTLGTNNSSIPAPSARRLEIIDDNSIERQADVGGRRGALDAAGLINAILEE